MDHPRNPGKPGRRKGSGARAGGDASWGLRAVQALADPSRWRMVRSLAETPRSLGELARDVGLSAGCTSHHVSILKEVGLVKTTRVARQVRCSLPEAGSRGATFLAAVEADEITISLISKQSAERSGTRPSQAAPELEEPQRSQDRPKRSQPMEDFLL
jgi:DNA-binding transcriptional ArsR family regulator